MSLNSPTAPPVSATESAEKRGPLQELRSFLVQRQQDSTAQAPAWLFGIAALSIGATSSAFYSATPFLLNKAGVKIESIGWYSIAVTIPMGLRFLYSAVTELGFRWKTWSLVLSMLIGVLFSIALRLPLPAHLTLFLSCLFAAQICCGMAGACQGALAATTLQQQRRDRAAGWFTTGIQFGGALGTFALIDLSPYYPQITTWLYTLLLVIPAASIWLIPEPTRPKRALREIVRSAAQEFRLLARQRATIVALLLSILPTGTWALMYFLPSLGERYHATPGMLAFANGATCWLFGAAGALSGGFACARYNRVIVYVLASTAVVGVELLFLFSPTRPEFYVAYTFAYYLVQGASLAAAEAVIFHVIKDTKQTTSLQINLLGSINFFAVMYVMFIDSQVLAKYGITGLLATDAALISFGIVLFAGFAWSELRTARRGATSAKGQP